MTTSDHSVVIIRESEADDPLFQRWQGMSRERTAYPVGPAEPVIGRRFAPNPLAGYDA